MPQEASKARIALRAIAAIALVATTLAVAPISLVGAAPATIDGVVFQDHDQDGVRDATEPGVEGVLVRAIDQNGDVENATSGSDGSYSISTNIDNANDYRIEFSIPASLDFLEPGPIGADSGGDVQYALDPGDFADVDFGVANPSDFCQANPTLAAPCFAVGDAAGIAAGNASEPALVLFDYDEGGTDFTGGTDIDLGPHAEVAFSDIGTTYGIANDPTGGFFVGTYIKRHAGILDQPGSIFRVSEDGTSVTPFATVSAGADPHPASTDINDWLRDSGVWDAVGKVGLGDLDVSDDGQTLWAMNLFSRQVESIAVSDGTVGAAFAAPVAPSCDADDSRPFALSADAGSIYAGVVCSQQSGGGTLGAYVFSTPQDTPGAWTLEVDIPLDGANYPRKCADSFGDGSGGTGNGSINTNDNDPTDVCDASTPNELNANWREWLPIAPPTDFTDGPLGVNSAVNGGNVINDPRWSSAMLTDIDFDNNGDMIIGLRSRFGDQTGNGTRVPDPAGSTADDIRGIGMGDILKACGDPLNGFVLEQDGSCGGIAGGGVDNDEGPGSAGDGTGGEFFNGDDHFSHDSLGNGGIYASKVNAQVADTMFDPQFNQIYEGGVTWHDPATGDRDKALRIFSNGIAQPGTFGKANGLGDLDASCDGAPVQIGDYVWFDRDGDGIQDADEPGLAGVEVTLVGGAGGIATTDANGHYTFTVDPATAYTLQFDISGATNVPDGFTPGDLELTQADQIDGDAFDADAVDSDGVDNVGTFEIAVPPHAAGENDQTFDIGFTATDPLRIGNFVWIDANDNGIVDPGENPVPDGLQVTLFLDNGNNTFEPGVDTSVTTTATVGGAYWFPDLDVGTYFVAVASGEGQLTGFRPSTDSFADDVDNNNNGVSGPAGFVSVSGPIALADDGAPDTEIAGDETAANSATSAHEDVDSNLTIDFGFFEPFAIGNQVFNDLNDDGIKQPAEPFINGVTVTLLTGGGAPTGLTTVTAGQGLYVFDDLPAGQYIVEVDASNFSGVLSGFQSTSPANTITVDQANAADDQRDNGTPVGAAGTAVRSPVITLGDAAGEPLGETPTSVTVAIDANADLTIDFGFNQRAGYGDRVWFDANGDGIQNASEPGINGVTVELFNAADVSQGTQVTAGVGPDAGGYFFADLVPGDYYAVFTLPDGTQWTQQDAPGGTNTSELTDSDVDPATGRTDNTTLDPSETDNTWDAGITVTASVDLEKQIQDPDDDTVWFNADTLDGETPLNDRFVAHLENGTATYRFVVTNTGPTDLTDVVITDDTLDCDPIAVGDLDSGASITVTPVDCTFGPLTGSLTNTATVTGTPTNSTGTPLASVLGLPDGSLDVSHVDTADADIVVPSIQITKTAAVDVISPTTPSVDFTLEVTNTSTNVPALENVDVNDPDCAGGPTFTGGDDGDGLLETGEIWTYSCTVDQPGGGWPTVFTNVADVTADVPATDPDGYPLPASPPVTDDDEDSVAVADLVVTKSVREQEQNVGVDGGPGPYSSSETVRTGEAVDWQVTVTNSGGVALANPSISESECGAITIGDAQISGTDTDGTTTLEPGETWTFDCSTDSVDTAITNTASFTATPVGSPDPVTQEATATATPVEPHVSVLIEVFDPFTGTFVDADDVAASEGDEGPAVVITSGGDVTYRVTVFNIDSSGDPGDSLVLTDVDVLVSIPGQADQTLNFGDLAPGSASTPQTIVVNNVTTSGTAVATVSTGGSTSGGEAMGPVDTNDGVLDFDDVDEASTRLAELTVKKFVRTSTIAPAYVDAQDGEIAPTTLLNEPIDYRVVLTNTGEVALGNVSADDAIPDCDLQIVDQGNGNDFLGIGEVWIYECTDADGQPSGDTFRNVASGSADPVNAVGTPIGEPVNDDDEANVDLIAPATLGDRVWLDRDRDGQQDPDTSAEPGIVGITVNLLDADGNQIDSTITGTDGFYQFTNLFPGDYIVQVVVPDVYTVTVQNVDPDATDSDIDPSIGATFGQTGLINLTEGENDPTNDAGLYLPASIGDFIWHDLNADGVQDDDEPGLPNVTVQLRDENNIVIDTQLTGPDGEYLFTDLVAGIYSVSIVPPGGFEVTTPNADGVDDALDSDIDPATLATGPITIEEGDVDLTVDGGLYQPASIGDFVWNDLDRDGVQDDDEPGIPDVTVTLLDIDGNPIPGVDPVLTGPDGEYAFTDLVPGSYIVAVTVPEDFTVTLQNATDDALDSDISPVTGLSAVVELTSGQEDLTIDAGLYLTSALGDTIFEDLNGNGIQDDGEPGILGATVTLLDENGDPIPGIDPIVTLADGLYLFDDLLAGTYFVRVDPPAGFELTLPNVGDDALDSDAVSTGVGEQGQTEAIVLGENVTDLTNDAGYYRPASIGNFVWDDLDGDGVQDADEPGIDGVTVQLLDEDGNIIDTTVTVLGGFYGFDGLAPGTYSIGIIPPDGTVLSPQDQGDDALDSDINPVTLVSGQVTLGSGDENLTLDAGVYTPATIGDVVFLDTDRDGVQDPSEVGVPNIPVLLLDDIGEVVDQTTTDDVGFYEFTDLPPGEYTVVVVPGPDFVISPQNVGDDDTVDSDADPITGVLDSTTLVSGQIDPDNDTGLSARVLDIAIVKTVGTQTGSEVVWNLLVTNKGPDDDPGPLTVTDVLPATITPKSATGVGWTCDIFEQTVTCVSDAGLAAGSSLEPILLTSTLPPAGTTVTNDASVQSTVVESTTVNNTDLATVTTPTPVTPSLPVQLPRTGAEALQWSLAGLLLVAMGALVGGFGRTRRRRFDTI